MIKDTVIIICSTPHSKRIPEKCFLKIAGKTVLEHILDRIKPLGIPTILAVPLLKNGAQTKKYIDLCNKYQVIYYSGNTDSPLHRMYNALDYYKAEEKRKPKYVIRITHDDVIIDAETIKLLYARMKRDRASYACTPEIVEGAGVEIILAKTIIEQAEKIKKPVEHISYFVKGNNPIKVKPRFEICRPYRLTLDYPEDAIVLETVLKAVGADASCDMICSFLDDNKMLLKYNELPLITIYTCMFNAEKWVNNCIHSVMMAANMAYRDLDIKYEYIVIDDGSTDQSLMCALKQLTNWHLENYRVVINKENIGLASSSNIALNMAKGKYIMRVDADDILLYTAVQDMIKRIIVDDSIIVYPSYETVNINADRTKHLDVISGVRNHHAGCALMNKKTINELKFSEGLRHWDSLDLYNKIKVHGLDISYMQEPQFLYRKHGGSLSARNTKERMDTLEKIVSKYGIKKQLKANE